MLSLVAYGQKIAKPTLISTAPTAEQSVLIKLGIALHDAKNYSQAIRKV